MSKREISLLGNYLFFSGKVEQLLEFGTSIHTQNPCVASLWVLTAEADICQVFVCIIIE